MSDYHSAFFEDAKKLLPGWLFDQIKATAIPKSGGMARSKLSNPSVFEKLALPHINQSLLRGLDNKELTKIMKRLSQLYKSSKRNKKDGMPYMKAASSVVKEMKKRGIEADEKLTLVRDLLSDDVEKSDYYVQPKESSASEPISERGYTAEEQLNIVAENLKFSPESAGFEAREDEAWETCNGCQFFRRPIDDKSPGDCALVAADVFWFSSCDLRISAESYALYRYAEAREEIMNLMMDHALTKAYESQDNSDDNNTDPKKPKVIIQKMLRQEGSKWVVYDSAGKKKLGSHASRSAALKQIAAVESSKVKKSQPSVNEVSDESTPKRDKELDRWLKSLIAGSIDGTKLMKSDEGIIVPIYKVAKKQQKVYGIVLEPNTTDTQGDTVSAEEIEKAAEAFMKSRVIGDSHTKLAKGVELTDNFVTQGETKIGRTSIKKGTWVIGVKVTDPAIWQKVEAGEFTGFSVGGHGKRVAL